MSHVSGQKVTFGSVLGCFRGDPESHFPVLLLNQGKTSKTSRIFLTWRTLEIPVKPRKSRASKRAQGNKNTKEKKDRVFSAFESYVDFCGFGGGGAGWFPESQSENSVLSGVVFPVSCYRAENPKTLK